MYARNYFLFFNPREYHSSSGSLKYTGYGNLDFRLQLTLEPETPRVSTYFTLEPADGGTLQAGEGSRLTFGLRLGRNGRDRRVALKVGAPR